MAASRRVHTSRLREHRQRLALTQQDVAMRLEQLAWVNEKRHVGVNADMVSKWERGLKRPSLLYERLLCALYSTTAAELDLRGDGRPAEVPAHRMASDFDDSQDLLGALEVVEGALAGSSLLMPYLVELWRKDVLSRRALLGAVAAIPFVPVTLSPTRPLAPASASGRVEPVVLDELNRIMAHLESSYHSLDGSALVLPIRAISETVEDLLAGTTASSSRGQLLALLARANLLAGRIMFFDHDHPFEARAHLDLAREASEQTGDSALLATVLGHMAFLPAAAHNFSAAESYLQAAWRVGLESRSHWIASWLLAVASEVHANAGHPRSSLQSVDASLDELASAGETSSPIWFDFYDDVRLAGFQGFALSCAGRHDEARISLESVVARAERLSPKQASVALVDLAGVHVAAGDLDEGCRLAASAAEELHRAKYATGVDRLRALRGTLTDVRSSAVRLLDDRISELR